MKTSVRHQHELSDSSESRPARLWVLEDQRGTSLAPSHCGRNPYSHGWVGTRGSFSVCGGTRGPLQVEEAGEWLKKKKKVPLPGYVRSPAPSLDPQGTAGFQPRMSETRARRPAHTAPLREGCRESPEPGAERVSWKPGPARASASCIIDPLPGGGLE